MHSVKKRTYWTQFRQAEAKSGDMSGEKYSRKQRQVRQEHVGASGGGRIGGQT